MMRKIVVAVASIFLLSLTADAKPPHVIQMVVDDLGWNDVGFHDNNEIHSYKVNALAEQGIKLDNYYVFRFCSPSRSTFMTGRYPYHIGQQTAMNLNPTPGIACGINLNYTFLPELLKTAGYQSYALGKWHLGYFTNSYTPTYRGAEHYLGYYSGAEEHFTHEKQGEGYTAFDLANNTGTNIQPCRDAVGLNGTYSSYLFGNESIRLIENHDPDTPMYMYLAWNNVHSPCEAPDFYVDANSHIEDKGRRNFAGMMSALDDGIPAVIDALKRKGMWENTILIYTTDNGGNLGGDGNNFPLRGGKYTFWQGGVRGVSFVVSPLLPQSRVNTTWSGLAHAADWYETIAQLAGITTANTGPVPSDGVNIWPGLSSSDPNATSPRTEVVINIESESAGNKFNEEALLKSNNMPEDLPVKPFPMLETCVPGNKLQQWIFTQGSGDISSGICDNTTQNRCFNVQQSKEPIILYAPETESNALFSINSDGQLVSPLRDGDCIVSPGVGQQLQFVQCPKDGPTFKISQTTGQLTATYSNGTAFCVTQHGEPPYGPNGTSLSIGVLIREQWKLIYGYPGWNAAWDGWIPLPSSGLEPEMPEYPKPCVDKPCLFDIFADPTEHNDVSAQHPDIVANMTARIFELAKSEVTLQQSGLCPTPSGTKNDPGCKAKAVATGFWEPWLNDTTSVLPHREL